YTHLIKLSFSEKIHFKMVSFVHETIYSIFVNPYKLLEQAGLKLDQTVLEVGCGPGHYTIPASKLVGENGFIYAIDINPFAIESVNKKVKKAGVKNVEGIVISVYDTGLDDQSVDLAFLFGVRHVLDYTKVKKEMSRILKNEGILATQKWGQNKKLISLLTENQVFSLVEETKKVLKFKKQAS
ncbi:MAG: class I SAM-dependent methyltransferase, partial [Candidatus Heimdallarchaeota archaeon]|nr:class I SAM-dependent methyltransferase [Candidatus Heimdallarchaeota archaeon]